MEDVFYYGALIWSAIAGAAIMYFVMEWRNGNKVSNHTSYNTWITVRRK